MEQITRTLVRDKGHVKLEYVFKTYDIIFHPPKNAKPNFLKLCAHLRDVFMQGLPEREQSASRADRLIMQSQKVDDLPFSELALQSNYIGEGRNQHQIVEDHFMKWCATCLATEFPVYNDDMTTCGDILLYYPNTDTIDILDFKPKAAQDKGATTQVYYTAKMLAFNTGISLADIGGYYFDHETTFKVL